MPRIHVPLINSERYHVFNRGVDKRKVFEHKSDYLRFYQCLHLFNTVEPVGDYQHSQSKFLQKDPLVRIEAYSLLPNHFHFILQQSTDGGISEFMKRIAGGYTSYFNEKYNRAGSLFQGTFKRVHISHDDQYRYVFAYVNENHFVHGIERPEEIIYSSSLHHQGKVTSQVISYTHRNYSFKENVLLAKNIRERRSAYVGSLLE